MRTTFTPTTSASGRAKRDVIEIAVGYALVLAAVWSPLPWAAIFFFTGVVWVTSINLSSGASRRELGLSFPPMKRDYWVISVSAAMALVAALLAIRYGTIHAPFSSTNPQMHVLGYLVWAFIQQFILQDYFLPRLLRLVPNKFVAVFIAAFLFAVAHIPNPLLTVATFVWGFVACMLFLRYRDLYTLGLAHAIFGLCLAVTVPNAIHHQMHVGLGYLRYQHDAVQESHELRITRALPTGGADLR